MIKLSLAKVLLSEKAPKKVNTLIHKIHHFSCLIDTTPVGKDELKRQTLVSSTVIFFVKKETINQDELYKPASKKNCRNKRLQVLHGQMAASQNLSTIM